MSKGGVFVVAGPSGSGKDTLFKELFKRRPEIKFSISSITRPMRVGEVEGEKYNFITREKFLSMLENDELLEYNEYIGNYYGTPKAPVIAAIEKGQDILIEVDVIDSFKKIRQSIDLISYASYLVELSSMVYKHDNETEIYNLLISSLKKINEGYDYMVITNILELKLLEYLGIKPVIDSCVNCGSKTDIVTISSYKGGYVCKKCVYNEALVDIKTIKLLRMFYYVDIDKITKLDISSKVKLEINRFIDDYYDRYSGLYLKSKEFLKNLKNI